MKYNPEFGKIYDTIFFLVEYFNQSEIKKEYIDTFKNTKFMLDCYDEINKKIEKIPNFIQPFFYINQSGASPLSSFFLNSVISKDENIDSFIVKITTNQNHIYNGVIETIFTSKQQTNKKDDASLTITSDNNYISLIESSEFSTEFKLNVSLLLGNFAFGISTLAHILKEVYLKVDVLYNKYQRELSLKFKKAQNEMNLTPYKKILNIPTEYNTVNASISLLNQYILFSAHDKLNTSILVGYNYEESVSDFLDDVLVSTEQFIVLCGNETRLKILSAIIENGEMTSSQIAHKMNCPITTMVRHINALNSNGIIYVSKYEGLQIFYKVNTKLFSKMQRSINKIFDNIIKNRREYGQ